MKRRYFIVALIFVMSIAETVFAAPTPTDGSKFYTIYDILVNDIVQGPPGLSLAVGGLSYGGMQLFRNSVLGAIGAIVGSAIMLASPTIASGLGAVIL